MKRSGKPDDGKPDVEHTNVVLVDQTVLERALECVSGCELCCDDALIPFDRILDVITGSDPGHTEYILPEIPQCPFCLGELREKTSIKIRRV